MDTGALQPGRRRVVLDIEATGEAFGHSPRICEVAAIEFNERFEPVASFQQYINPMARVTPGAFRVHGLSNQFLRSYPRFHRVCDSLLDFLQGAEVYAHGAGNDRRYLDLELSRDGRRSSLESGIAWVDTLAIAKQIPDLDRPGIDGLCEYFGMDPDLRSKHGAMTDCALLLSLLPLMEGQLEAGWEPDGIIEWTEIHERHLIVLPGFGAPQGGLH